MNGWVLLASVSLLISVAMIQRMSSVDLTDHLEVSGMIQYSVRWSVPWLYLAFVASSLRLLFPNAFSLWLLRNRRYLGLCFAAGFAWQLTFIVWLATGYGDYFEQENPDTSLYIQVPGYVLLIAMSITSFSPVRRLMRPQHWRWLHKVGIYYLWVVVWSTYWFELYYYDEIELIDYIYYWAGLLVWLPRPIAWALRRNREPGAARGVIVLTGVAAVAGFAASTWAPWANSVYETSSGVYEQLRNDWLSLDVLLVFMEYIPPMLPVLAVALVLPILFRTPR